MPPQNPVTESEQKCPWYQPLCKVTRVSKYLALVIFIAAPFVGGYVGYQLALDKPAATVYIQAPTTTTVESPEVIPVTPASPVTAVATSTSDPMANYIIGKQYGKFVLVSDSTTTAEGYSFPVAHTFSFEGQAKVKGEIIIDSIMSPFIKIVNATTTGLPSLTNGFNVVPDFMSYGYDTTFMSNNADIAAIYKEAALHKEWSYSIEFEVTSLQIQVGAPKASSIMISKIKGAPTISTTTKEVE